MAGRSGLGWGAGAGAGADLRRAGENCSPKGCVARKLDVSHPGPPACFGTKPGGYGEVKTELLR